MLCTLIGAIILSINIQVGLNMHLYDDMHRRLLEGGHLVKSFVCFAGQMFRLRISSGMSRQSSTIRGGSAQ